VVRDFHRYVIEGQLHPHGSSYPTAWQPFLDIENDVLFSVLEKEKKIGFLRAIYHGILRLFHYSSIYCINACFTSSHLYVASIILLPSPDSRSSTRTFSDANPTSVLKRS
jgi:hypothetical protein